MDLDLCNYGVALNTGRWLQIITVFPGNDSVQGRELETPTRPATRTGPALIPKILFLFDHRTAQPHIRNVAEYAV